LEESFEPILCNGLKFVSDGSLTITISSEQPVDARANWLPALEGQFALIVRAYVLSGVGKSCCAAI
jgi:hypothetical protein